MSNSGIPKELTDRFRDESRKTDSLLACNETYAELLEHKEQGYRLQSKLNKQIVAAFESGANILEISANAGMNRNKVSEVIKRHEARQAVKTQKELSDSAKEFIEYIQNADTKGEDTAPLRRIFREQFGIDFPELT